MIVVFFIAAFLLQRKGEDANLVNTVHIPDWFWTYLAQVVQDPYLSLEEDPDYSPLDSHYNMKSFIEILLKDPK